MRKILFPALTVLIVTMLLLTIPTEAEGAIYEDTVRLHILANSDSKEDQAVKLLVRDAVLSEFSAVLADAESQEDAVKKIESITPEIVSVAERVIKENGYTYEARVRVDKEWYGTREYDNFTLPAGEYTSLVISLGDAEGKNWWCVMYPPLCLDACTEDASIAYSDEEIKLIKPDGLKIKFKTLELFSKYFG